MPMDETLAVGGDRSGRPRRTRSSICGSRSAASAICRRSWSSDFFEGFAQGARANVHVKVLYGRSSHHQIEAVFKAFARALRVACARDPRHGADAAEHEGAAVIALIDYGAGNLTSVRKGFAAAGAELFTPADPSELDGVERHRRSRRRPLRRDRRARRRVARGDPARRRAGTPLLGICLGMQWLFEGSDEAPGVSGLGAIAGGCSRLPRDESGALKVPHVGWNSLHCATAVAAARRASSDGSQVYFTHSYAAPGHGASRVATCTHGATVRGGGRGRATSSACSSTRRSRATRESGSCATSLDVVG